MKSPFPIDTANSDYAQALAFLDSLDVSAMKLGLARIERVLITLGNPQEALPIVHVGGTNGKGSTVAMLDSVLRASGLKVGTFTSPHLVDVRERVRLDGEMISEADFTREIEELKAHLEGLGWERDDWPTYFEFLNIVAYRFFQRNAVDVALFEVGLGGRLDSTNVVQKPLVSVITGIGYDHMERLGDTLAKIAFEKAGIIKPGAPVVFGPNIPEEAMSVLSGKARECESPVIQAAGSRFASQGMTSDGLQAVLEQKAGKTIALSLLGPYQTQNLATVFAVVETLRTRGFEISDVAVAEGLRNADWPARFQHFPEQRLLVDGSHNPQGFQSLREGLRLYFPHRPLHWILSLRNNRAPEDLMETVLSFLNTRSVIWTAGPRSDLYHNPEEMAGRMATLGRLSTAPQAVDDPVRALDMLREALASEPDALGVVTGSLYTAGDILRAVRAH